MYVSLTRWFSSIVLSRVQAFLPQLEASNALLASKDPSELDIENVDMVEEGEEIIEMVRLLYSYHSLRS